MRYFHMFAPLFKRQVDRLQIRKSNLTPHYTCIKINYTSNLVIYGFKIEGLKYMKSNYFILFFSLLSPTVPDSHKDAFVEAIK